ncbi:MAG: hypothetical protein A2174_02480 [Candidatus Portnoybacteria bacterium RBG_13_41_18]|uniref:Phosphatidic acid phosphatase type 2/haloperoxidase domain-containing protein n=1 Tax=Candidatus Portnoybacteria bacterium RBG_13_41_18 TaxID=1801991 RepID=A0A1G2FBN8_9BACT|nr:MAG: hypothetical protein A2174_02480 [Candidatus Portnoybacteria bacterium RBG_13_41_18]
MDYLIFQQVNSLAGKYLWLDTIGIFFASYFQYVLVAGLLVSMLLRKDKTIRWKNFKITVLTFGAAIVSRFFFGEIIKRAIARPRPYEVYQDATTLILAESHQSFPSGHMLFFFALSFVLYFYNKKLGWTFFVASFLIGLARIFVGIHYPSDILGGMVLGILVGWGSWKISPKKILNSGFLPK